MKHGGTLRRWSARLLMGTLVVLLSKTAWDFRWPVIDFHAIRAEAENLQIVDRHGKPLTFSYRDRWNTVDNLALHDIPELLRQAFLVAEDQRFLEHHGVDWLARGNALWQRLRLGRGTRGASTITEQVVRMLHPRPRSYWSKWIEGLEALALETRVNKAAILELYLNQVPYSSNRRGVVQAARFYFNRDVSTLSVKEMLALAVLVRAPSKFDLHEGTVPIAEAITRLARALVERRLLDEASALALRNYEVVLDAARLPVRAVHFVEHVRAHTAVEDARNQTKIVTTLDGTLQHFVEDLLENRLHSLSSKNIEHAAAIVVDTQTREILAWVSVGAGCAETEYEASGCKIDMVTVPRQPGSALKPFLYGAALAQGWTPATIIEDSPYSDTVGTGIHHFHNYSHTHYGKVTLRTALGNSLNIPALHAIQYVTPEKYLGLLRTLGFQSLTRAADFYDEGLALGSGEVSLLELARAYTVFANRGIFAPLKMTLYRDAPAEKTRIYSDGVASLIGDILSDPWARSLEFGRGGVLHLPTQTAVKTGTSTDYRDAWAIGYNHRYLVGIWMGNADYTPTDGVTGSIGPALVLRGIFNELTRNAETAPLYLSPQLVVKDVCLDPEDVETHKSDCAVRTEYFLPEEEARASAPVGASERIAIFRPANGLEMAYDPRIPREKQAFEMRLTGVLATDEVEWIIDEKHHARAVGDKFVWHMEKGRHFVAAVVWRNGVVAGKTAQHAFQVK